MGCSENTNCNFKITHVDSLKGFNTWVNLDPLDEGEEGVYIEAKFLTYVELGDSGTVGTTRHWCTLSPLIHHTPCTLDPQLKPP